MMIMRIIVIIIRIVKIVMIILRIILIITITIIILLLQKMTIYCLSQYFSTFLILPCTITSTSNYFSIPIRCTKLPAFSVAQDDEMVHVVKAKKNRRAVLFED